MRDGECRHRHGHAPPVPNEDYQRQDKKKMIEAEQDVLDAKAQIGRGDFTRAWHGLNNERRPCRRKPLGLYCAGKAFYSNQYISR